MRKLQITFLKVSVYGTTWHLHKPIMATDINLNEYLHEKKNGSVLKIVSVSFDGDVL